MPATLLSDKNTTERFPSYDKDQFVRPISVPSDSRVYFAVNSLLKNSVAALFDTHSIELTRIRPRTLEKMLVITIRNAIWVIGCMQLPRRDC